MPHPSHSSSFDYPKNIGRGAEIKNSNSGPPAQGLGKGLIVPHHLPQQVIKTFLQIY